MDLFAEFFESQRSECGIIFNAVGEILPRLVVLSARLPPDAPPNAFRLVLPPLAHG
jgi:hypothetical protein